MAQIAPIIVFDGAAVSHTFTPVSVTRDKSKIMAEYREVLISVPTYASPRLTLTLETLKSGVTKTESRVVIPVMEATNGANSAGYTAAPKVAYENTVVTTGYFHERSDLAGRRLLRQLSTNLQNAVATSVVAASVGPVPELIDVLVVPN